MRGSPTKPHQQTPLGLPLPLPIRAFLIFLKRLVAVNLISDPLMDFLPRALKKNFNFKKKREYCLKKKLSGFIKKNTKLFKKYVLKIVGPVFFLEPTVSMLTVLGCFI
jgi:hypothetical protein